MSDKNYDDNHSPASQQRAGAAAELSSAKKGKNDNNHYFSFKYTESGGLTARYLLVSFDSNTNTLTSSTDISGSNLSQKTITESDKQELKEAIVENNFFESKPDYPPEKEDDPSLIAYSLAITMDDKTHTAAWTSTSKERPNGITKIVDAIRRITAKEKVV
jgi:hypothetical protein